MSGSIAVVGYRIPLVVVLVVLALVIGLALTVSFWLTIALSTYRSVQQTQRDSVRDDLQTEFLSRLFGSDADWGPWVAGLSKTDRRVVESLLDDYLRELDGDEVESLRALGRELGLVERSTRQLRTGDEYERLYALAWLTLLTETEPLAETGFEPSGPRERAAVARLYYESDDLGTPAEGIEILLEDATTQFGVFGQDTLYRIASEDPSALFAIAADRYQQWSVPLVVQVLVVCRHVGSAVRTEDLSWVTAMLEADEDSVRAAGARALASVGWRTDVRDDLLVDRLLADPSPRVRAAVYQMLAEWGDRPALDRLSGALDAEVDERALLVGTTALVARRDELPGPLPRGVAVAWEWSREHAAYDRRTRRPVRVTD